MYHACQEKNDDVGRKGGKDSGREGEGVKEGRG